MRVGPWYSEVGVLIKEAETPELSCSALPQRKVHVRRQQEGKPSASQEDSHHQTVNQSKP